jgi:cbb3-type cytochrome oxidase subunit 1
VRNSEKTYKPKDVEGLAHFTLDWVIPHLDPERHNWTGLVTNLYCRD